MDLLFKEANFGTNFQDLLGFVDEDMEYKFIKSDLISATRDIIKLVGQDAYQLAVNDFINQNNTELLHAFEFAIGLNAYRIHAPTNDLKHSTSGRLMRSNDNEKSPFAWMIDRDNANQEKKYYKAVDDLLYILKDKTEFTNSTNYQKLNELIINQTHQLDDFMPVDSRLLLIKLMPGLRMAELQHLKPILGLTLFNQAKTDLSQLDESMQINIKGMLIYHAFAWAIPRLSVQLLPDAVVQNFMSDRSNTKSTQAPKLMELPLAVQSFKNDAQFYAKELADQVQALEPIIVETQETTTTTQTSNKFFST